MSSSSIVVTVLVALVVGAGFFLNRAPAQTNPDSLVLTQLRKAGSNLGKPHDIEFFLYFPSEAAAGRVASKLRGDGFGVTVSPAAGGGADWLALATRSMVPEGKELVRLRNMFTLLSSAENGNYDGWGTPVVK
ncbi:MAG: ribonuclease E inhibitor RraB [Burkholderiales bacterium]|nr:ribonuclease E inhibitor RraB [Burkholderiales bacterium]